MNSQTVLPLLLLLMGHIQLSTQFDANFCFNRKRDMDCSLQSPGFAGGVMTVESVTLLLSVDADKLKRYTDGTSCGAVEIDCRMTVRADNRNQFSASMLRLNDDIIANCSGKTECYIQVPSWNAVNGTTSRCEQRNPGINNFHLRGVFLDISCALPPLTTTQQSTPNEQNSTIDATKKALTSSTTQSPTMRSTQKSSTTEKSQGSGKEKKEPPRPIFREQSNNRSKESSACQLIMQPLVVFIITLLMLSW